MHINHSKKLIRTLIFINFFLTLAVCASSQPVGQLVRLTGKVQAEESGEVLAYASIRDSASGQGALSDPQGVFSMSVRLGAVVLQVSAGGFSAQRLRFVCQGDTFLYVSLRPQLQLDTVEIRHGGDWRPVGGINQETLRSLPSLGGEPDLIKAFQSLAGVAGGNEGSAEIHVRGGSGDQNLFLLDEAPIYNNGHLLGFVSVFNPDAVASADLYKGGLPARFGGRLSSVVDVAFKNGNARRWAGGASIGLLNSRVRLEGPLGSKGKTTLLIAGRTTYIDLLQIGQAARTLARERSSYTGYRFGDVNLKISSKPSDRLQLFGSVMAGLDWVRSISSSASYISSTLNKAWQYSASARLHYLISPRCFLRSGLYLSGNDIDTQAEEELYDVALLPPPAGTLLPPTYEYTLTEALFSAQRRDNGLGGAYANLSWYASRRWSINTGVEVLMHRYWPGRFASRGVLLGATASVSTRESLAQVLMAGEASAYAEVEVSLSRWARLRSGGRFSRFSHGGHAWLTLDPRVLLSLQGRSLQLQASFQQTRQFDHALLAPGQIQDQWFWVPASQNLPPQRAWQGSIDLSLRPPDKNFAFSAAVYYKQMHQLVQFRGSEIQNSFIGWEDYMLGDGEGKAWGAELEASTSWKRFNARASYTLAWSFRRFPQLEQGAWFPDYFDRRHNAFFHLIYRPSPRWQLSLTQTLASGRRISIPLGYTPETLFSSSYWVFESLNDFRLPAYHRMDASCYWTSPERKQHRTWRLGLDIYNLYNRHNPYTLYVDTKYEADASGRLQRKNVLTSIAILPFLPSISVAYAF